MALEPRFASMIAGLEASARVNPGSYRRKVVAAGFFGYAVIGSLLLLLVGLTLLMLWLILTTRTGVAAELKGAFVFGLLSFSLIRALWVPRPEPVGVEVRPEDAPALFAMLERVRMGSGGPRIHQVRITNELNAAVNQDATFLIFGARNTLYLGLPLLMAMRAEEVEAVIAHELGHFAGAHGHTSGFVYRIRVRWGQISERLPQGFVAGLLRRFFGWYGPWFAAYSFVLSRQHEYEADRVSANVAGTSVAGHALKRIAVQSERFSATWSDIWRNAGKDSEPPLSPYHSLAEALQSSAPADPEALDRALRELAGIGDTHPTLEQRLLALGEGFDLPPPLDTSAAFLLGEKLEAIQSGFDGEWRAWAAPIWAETFAQRQADIAERAVLAEKTASEEATSDDLLRLALLVEGIDGPEAAVGAFSAVLQHYPDTHVARFRRGDVLLDLGNEEGVADLLDAAAAERVLEAPAYRRLVGYFHAVARPEETQRYMSLLEDAEAMERIRNDESSTIDENARLRPLDPATREQLVALAASVHGVRTLRAAFRDLVHSSKPQIVFVFTVKGGVIASEVLDKLIDAFLPAGDVFGIQEARDHRWLAKRIAALHHSKIVS
ncbi:M48 family metallopeptidase [uncultured Sphingosinicella sp.]|uniref:M48 family metallopeptidase n=1 Tax=uncultured Sphingosinicella sp. TaxID=478748 RepID=UPI0030DA7B93